MILTIDLPEQIKTRLEADAREQGKPVAEIAAERLTELYAEYDAPMEPEAVEIVNAALTDFERGERGILLEDLREGWQEKRTAERMARHDFDARYRGALARHC